MVYRKLYGWPKKGGKSYGLGMVRIGTFSATESLQKCWLADFVMRSRDCQMWLVTPNS